MRCETIHLKEYFPQLGQNGCDARVDYYLPFNMDEMGRENQKRPCIIVCPGGGYRRCSQREAEVIGAHFLPEGYNVFVIYYSVAPHRFPQQLRELAALMELIYKNSEEWNCDTSKISMIGFSAGGHLAAHYSTMYDCEEVRQVFPESKNVNTCILGYPVISAEPDIAHQGSFENLLGHYPETIEEQKYFSCECNVDENTPPTFIWHTAKDRCVPVQNSLLYAQALASHDVPFELRIYPFGGHGLATVDVQTNGELEPKVAHAGEWINAVKRWLKIMQC